MYTLQEKHQYIHITVVVCSTDSIAIDQNPFDILVVHSNQSTNSFMN